MKKLNERNFDLTDTPDHRGRPGAPVPPSRRPAVTRTAADPRAPRMNPSSHLPGLPPEKRKQEAPAAPARRRPNTPTQQLTPFQSSSPAPSTMGPERNWHVTVPGRGTFNVPARSEDEAKQAIATWFREDQDDPAQAIPNIDWRHLQAVPAPNAEGAIAGGSLAGRQGGDPPTYERLRHAVLQMVREVVRKKEGGGGYVLYGPNKGKKKNPKPAGEFPTRIAAKRAELARFPPKDPEQLKKLRKRLDKLAKDPKKRADAEKKERQAASRPKRSGRPAGARSKKKEAFIRMMARDLHERLFHEEELPGSPWDERIASMHPDALSTDKKLAAFNKAMQAASIGALGDAHKSLSKSLRGLAKVMPGDHAHDPQRQKTFIPVMLDVDGTEIGPVHLYVDGGHVKIEVSDEAREAITGLDPVMARDLRGGLMSFQEDALPKVDRARKAWADRDAYLDKIHGKLEKHIGSMSGVEHHLVRQLLNKQRRSR